MIISYDSFDYEEHNSFCPQLAPSLDINEVLEEGERDAEEGLKFISDFANSPFFKSPEPIGVNSNFSYKISSKPKLGPVAFESSLQAHLKNSLKIP